MSGFHTPVPSRASSARLHTLAIAGGAVLATFAGLAPAAQAAPSTLHQTYTCDFPLVGKQPVVVDITAAIPTSWPVNVLTDRFAISANATLSQKTLEAFGSVGATSLEGLATAFSTVDKPHTPTASNPATRTLLDLQVPIALAKQPIDTDASSAVLAATGTMPQITLPAAGTAYITVNGLSLNLKASRDDGSIVQFNPSPSDPVPGTTDSDIDPNTFDVACTLDAGQPTSLATIGLTPPPTVTPIPTPFGDPTPPPPTPTPVPTGSPAPPTPTPTKTPAPTPTPTPTPTDEGNISYDYTLSGAATLKNLIKGQLPLSGHIYAYLTLETGNFTAPMALDETTAKLTALGFLPVVAKVDIVPTTPVTGNYTYASRALTATAKVRIKLPKITTFGIQIAGGANCQAAQVSTIPLASVGKFTTLDGGTLAGTFSISNLTGCGALNGIVSPLTAGSGNAISLVLAKG